jgi:hypothetical protein
MEKGRSPRISKLIICLMRGTRCCLSLCLVRGNVQGVGTLGSLYYWDDMICSCNWRSPRGSSLRLGLSWSCFVIKSCLGTRLLRASTFRCEPACQPLVAYRLCQRSRIDLQYDAQIRAVKLCLSISDSFREPYLGTLLNKLGYNIRNEMTLPH